MNYCSTAVYPDLECIVDPLTGSGSIIMQHDLAARMSEALTSSRDVTDMATAAGKLIEISLTYTGVSTEDELQSVLVKSETCYQTVTMVTKDCWMSTKWTSLNTDVWEIDAALNLTCTR